MFITQRHPADTHQAGLHLVLDREVMAPASRVNQREDDIQRHRQAILRVLQEATGSVVHIDTCDVDRMDQSTTFVLSDDSVSMRYEGSIRTVAARRLNPNIYEIVKESHYNSVDFPNFPVSGKRLCETLAIRARAVLISYTPLDFILYWVWALLLFGLWAFFGYVVYFMVAF